MIRVVDALRGRIAPGVRGGVVPSALGMLLALAACRNGAAGGNEPKPDVGSTDSTPAEDLGSATASDDEGSELPSCELGSSDCPCGSVGCPCATDGVCTDATCNEHSGTCVRIEGDMAYVPQGPFLMGCLEGVDTDALWGPCPENELPHREVTLDAFWLDLTEVTKGDYRKCMEAGACTEPYLWDYEWSEWDAENEEVVWKPGRDDMPAASVNWIQAREYCAWAGKRLPTEAEWEKACRGTDARKYAWGNEEPICDHARHARWDIEGRKPGQPCPIREEFRSIAPVGIHPKGTSPYGLLDMVGNVNEWVQDGYEIGVGYEDLSSENPRGAESDTSRAIRGGGYQAANFAAGGYVLRCAQRRGGGAGAGAVTLEAGLRCARDAAR